MEMEFEAADGDRVTGRVRVPSSISCPRAWTRFVGTTSGERISIQYDLGASCKVDVTLSVDRKENSLLSGTYRSVYSDIGGIIRLTRQ